MAFYAVLLDGNNDKEIVMMKATSDPNVDGNWSNQSKGVHVNDKIHSIWAVLDGTDIHVATAQGGLVSRWAYHKFSTTSDTWTIRNEEITTGIDLASLGEAISISVRSDGDVIVLYNETTFTGTIHSVKYARREGTTWTVGIVVDNGGVDGWSGAVIVKGSSDRMHFFFKNDDNNDAFQRTLTSANVLETFPAAGDADVRAINHVFAPGISYNDSGTQRIRCPYMDAGTKISYAEFDSADAPGAFTINADISENIATVLETPIACTALDGTDEHLLYAQQIILDLFHDKNGGVDVEEIDDVSVRRISCNVYNRSGQKLAFVWLDDTTTKYGEISLAAAVINISGFVVGRNFVDAAASIITRFIGSSETATKTRAKTSIRTRLAGSTQGIGQASQEVEVIITEEIVAVGGGLDHGRAERIKKWKDAEERKRKKITVTVYIEGKKYTKSVITNNIELDLNDVKVIAVQDEGIKLTIVLPKDQQRVIQLSRP